MRDVAVVGAGIIDFGTLYEQSTDDLVEEAYLNAVESVDRSIDRSAIETAWFGTVNLAGDAATGVGLAHPTSLFEIPINRVENACATGSSAFRNAALEIQSGAADIAVVIGVEKMYEDPEGLIGRTVLKRLWRRRGMSMPAFFGLRAQRHMHEYGTTREQIAQVSVKNHENGSKYPHAHQQFTCDIDDVLDSPTVSAPLTLYDCCPVTDGAAAVVLASEDVVGEYTDEPVWVAGSGLSTDSVLRKEDESLVGFPATQNAASSAFSDAGLMLQDVDVAEVHDCFTITELITYEDLGFCERGKGGQFIEEGRSTLDGDLPVNPSGGLLSKGHPVGATGVAQIVEIYEQLRGEAGPIQVADDPRVGLQHNIGLGRNATGSVSCVNVLTNDQPT
jgi:acetyl-CoA C-acetyltransferase